MVTRSWHKTRPGHKQKGAPNGAQKYAPGTQKRGPTGAQKSALGTQKRGPTEAQKSASTEALNL
jgi:hypothetical protein